MRTTTPGTVDQAAAVLAEAARDGRRVAIRGGGTKADWSPADSADIVLSTLGLNRIVAHRHGDLTATVEAGARLDDVNRELARQGQWIALDPAWSDRATIGGVVAAYDSGPRRHRYGAPRDVIIGVEIARADGVRAKAGGIVVKNVAGYDLSRLMTGSFGSLALITCATFKLYPIPPASRTVVIGPRSHAETAALVGRVLASQLTPTAVELQTPPRRLLVRFEATAASVEAQSAALLNIANSFGVTCAVVQGDEEQHLWIDHRERPWSGPGIVFKITLLPTELGDLLDAVESAAAGAPFDAAGRAGVGVLLVRLDVAAEAQARAVAQLKQRIAPGRGSLVVLRGSDALKAAAPAAAPRDLMQSVKRAFDPSGVLAYRGIQ